MEYKIVLSNPEDGRAYQIQADEEKSQALKGKKIGDVISADALGLKGYEIMVTGGSDKSGFPMRKGVDGDSGKDILSLRGQGFKSNTTRRKKRVHGQQIGDNIVQVNAKITKTGKKSIEELLGRGEAEEEASKEEQ
ncbi:MAG: 30S ribosomal protein S6e [Candidatus Altiarchaeales archaeon]|nr:30S ribosomal protein S6e [Candidatus Altiarchaeales archaeon]